jgi:hypothetical protein
MSDSNYNLDQLKAEAAEFRRKLKEKEKKFKQEQVESDIQLSILRKMRRKQLQRELEKDPKGEEKKKFWREKFDLNQVEIDYLMEKRRKEMKEMGLVER